MKLKLISLYILNVSDMVFTKILLSSGFAQEVNPVVKGIVQKPLMWMLKVVLVGLLLYYIYKRMEPEKRTGKIRIANKIINLAIGFYAVINVLHVIWCSMAFVFQVHPEFLDAVIQIIFIWPPA